MLSGEMPDLYDWSPGRTEWEDLLVDPSQHGYRQVAATLRNEILSGRLQPGDKLESQPDLARRFDLDVTGISRAAALLAQWGLVRVEKGRPTIVLALRPYSAVITVPRAGQRQAGEDQNLGDAARLAAGTNPSIRDVTIVTGTAEAQLRVAVDCPDVGRAAVFAFQVAQAAFRDGGDLASARIEAGPDTGRE